jgi:hypothetical protein
MKVIINEICFTVHVLESNVNNIFIDLVELNLNLELYFLERDDTW